MALVAVLLAAGSAIPQAAASTARLAVERIDTGSVQASGIVVDLRPAVGRGEWTLTLNAKRLAVPGLKQELNDVSWHCPHFVPEDNPRCEGMLEVRGRAAGTLLVALGESTALDWRDGRRRARLASRGDGPWTISLARIPLAWFDALLRERWAGGTVAGGEIGGTGTLRPDGVLSADITLRELAFDTPDGTLAGAGVTGRFVMGFAPRADGDRLRLSGRVTAGEVLVAPVYLAVPEGGVEWALEATIEKDGGWMIPTWRWQDAGVLEASGSAALDGAGTFVALDARASSPDLGTLRQRYLEGVLAPAGFPNLALHGAADAALAFDADGLSTFSLEARDAGAVDPAGRLRLGGLEGDLRWSRDAAVADSALGWQVASLYGIDIEASKLHFESRDRRLALREPASAALLGGRAELLHLRWQPRRGDEPLSLELGLALDGLDLARVSRQLGWPSFTGRLDGRLPNVRYQGGRLVFGGGLSVGLFGGQVGVDDLVLERLFGVAPSLSADVRFDDIDLAPLTGAFGFGEITGRLDGRIRDLRLVDWSPVAFDARLLTDREWRGTRRISQRAVQNISDLGGAGLVAGLQARVLRLFDDFGYDRIGIGCVLRDNVCRMSGLKRRGDGYLIVEGRGLPRIEVVGFRRQVDWPTLVDRLQAATEGGVRIGD